MLKVQFKTDTFFKAVCLGCGAVTLLLTLGLCIQLFCSSGEAWTKFGLGFLVSSEWNPADELYGALPGITGTLITTAIALVIALPLAYAAAMYLVDAPPWAGNVLSHTVDLLAAIPSVIFGMWGLFILAPLMQDYVQPFINKLLHTDMDYNGFGLFTAGVILSVMILPYMCAVFRDVFRMTPAVLRESAFGIGCTRYEVSKDIILRYGIRGILGGIFIGLGRALGETMAVLFVIGNMMEMPSNIFSSATTISATLANNFAEADGMQRSALFALGLVLLGMCFTLQLISQYYLHSTARKRGEK